MMNRTEKKVEDFVRKYDMIGEDDTVVTGVSGGADSVCLLFMLCALRRRKGFRVLACHVNHGLRGEDADADEAYVRELCERLGVPLRIFRENVELIARKRKQSTEEAGRLVRREAFEKMCREDGGTKIATAHHRDDNAETVLLNIARGTGLRGLCGIRPVRGRWIRPLLCLSRDEIEEWLREKKISFCTEEQVNAGAARHLSDLALQAQEVWDHIEKETDWAESGCVAFSPDAEGRRRVRIDEAGFERLDPVIAKTLIHRCICRAAGEEKDVEAGGGPCCGYPCFVRKAGGESGGSPLWSESGADLQWCAPYKACPDRKDG